MTKLVVVCGQKNSGKTSWVCALVDVFTKKGLKVGTLKHTHHRHDVEGKDTDRHQVSGAEKVILVSPEGLAIYRPYNLEPTIRELVDVHFSSYDFVFAEGYRTSDVPKIIVDNDPNANPINTIAKVSPALQGKVNQDSVVELSLKIEDYFS